MYAIKVNNESVSPKLFSLTEKELTGTKKYSKYDEGTQYAYYAAGNSKAKKLNGNLDNWWLSSTSGSQGITWAVIVTQNGTGSTSTMFNASNGVAFAFCF